METLKINVDMTQVKEATEALEALAAAAEWAQRALDALDKRQVSVSISAPSHKLADCISTTVLGDMRSRRIQS